MPNWKPHPKQLEFINDDRPRVLYGGGLPSRSNPDWIKKLFMEDRFVWDADGRYVMDRELWRKYMDTSGVQFNAPPINLHTSIETALQDYYHQIPEGKKGGVFGVVTKDSDGKLLTNAVIAIKAGDKLEVGGYIGKKWGGDLVYGLDAKFFF